MLGLHSALAAVGEGLGEKEAQWKSYEEVEHLWDQSQKMPDKIRVDLPENPFLDDSSLSGPCDMLGHLLTFRAAFPDLKEHKQLHTEVRAIGLALGKHFSHDHWDELALLLREETELSQLALSTINEMLEKESPDLSELPGTVQWAIATDEYNFPVFYKGAMYQIEDLGEEARAELCTPVEERKEKVAKLLENIKQNDFDPVAFSEQLLQETVKRNEQDAIQLQVKNFEEWEAERLKAYDVAVADKDSMDALEEIEEKRKHLEEKEQLILYFDNEKRIHVLTDEKKSFIDNRFETKEKIKKSVVDDYIPNHVRSRRNVRNQ